MWTRTGCWSRWFRYITYKNFKICMQVWPLKYWTPFDGVQLQGPCASLCKAGKRGKFASNCQRDIMRKVANNDPQQVLDVRKVAQSCESCTTGACYFKFWLFLCVCVKTCSVLSTNIFVVILNDHTQGGYRLVWCTCAKRKRSQWHWDKDWMD